MTRLLSHCLRLGRSALPMVLGLWVASMGLASLSGCAGPGPAAAAPNDSYTASDEPESRKRAGNRLKLAVAYFQDGKYPFALDEVKLAIQTDPGWFQPYWMRGLIYMQMGDYAAAEGSYQKALAIAPQSGDVRHNYGVLLCKMQRPTEARKQFESALQDPAYGQRAKTWLELGNCQLTHGQKTEAEASFMRALELDAANPVTSYNLASLLYGRGEWARAQFYARRVNNSDRASPESLWLGIKIERSLGAQDAQAQLEAQLRKRFAQSREALALERGAFHE